LVSIAVFIGPQGISDMCHIVSGVVWHHVPQTSTMLHELVAPRGTLLHHGTSCGSLAAWPMHGPVAPQAAASRQVMCYLSSSAAATKKVKINTRLTGPSRRRHNAQLSGGAASPPALHPALHNCPPPCTPPFHYFTISPLHFTPMQSSFVPHSNA